MASVITRVVVAAGVVAMGVDAGAAAVGRARRRRLRARKARVPTLSAAAGRPHAWARPSVKQTPWPDQNARSNPGPVQNLCLAATRAVYVRPPGHRRPNLSERVLLMPHLRSHADGDVELLAVDRLT